MYYVLTEEEFKEYRLCRAEIIDLYNRLVLTNSDSEYAQKKIKLYSNILGVETGELYKGI